MTTYNLYKYKCPHNIYERTKTYSFNANAAKRHICGGAFLNSFNLSL